MQMPDMDGDQTALEIRDTLGRKDLPLVLLSSIGARLTDEELRMRGYKSALNKPARQSQLRRAVLEALTPVHETHAAEKSGQSQAFSGTRVLLAEDNLVNQRVAMQLLKKMGCVVDVVPHGRAALAALDRERYDVILMDCQMPEMDGFEATAEIRRSGRPWQNIPIVAITAHAMTGDRELCLNSGMNDYISKPVRAKELTEVLSRWVRAKGPELPGVDVLDRDFLTVSCALDPAAAQAVLDEFRFSLPASLAEIQKAFEAQDDKALVYAAHSLCGGSRAVGAKRLAAACARVEELAKQSAARKSIGTALRRLEVEAEHLLAALNLPKAA
jgi:CheY-like chemotaxis protein/HPt (histidine-containing phosphotransfer) domain-containing protein